MEQAVGGWLTNCCHIGKRLRGYVGNRSGVAGWSGVDQGSGALRHGDQFHRIENHRQGAGNRPLVTCGKGQAAIHRLRVRCANGNLQRQGIIDIQIFEVLDKIVGNSLYLVVEITQLIKGFGRWLPPSAGP